MFSTWARVPAPMDTQWKAAYPMHTGQPLNGALPEWLPSPLG
jgi:hypothetical protein